MLITIPKRRPKRVRVLLYGSLETATSFHDVRVRDISEGGVLIETAHTLCEGDPVKLWCLDHLLEGKVVWCKGSWIGIRLNQTIPAAAWANFSRQALRVGAPRNYRHDLIPSEDECIEVTPRSIRIARFTGKR